jgi:NADPH-dependent glutamate synthase beta subunit-like oxidoreductase
MAAIYRTLLDEIKHENFQVLHQRIALTPVRKIWIAWKTWAFAEIRMKVAVIGGGWAGIAAAVELTAAGADTTLYRSRPRSGWPCPLNQYRWPNAR